MGHKMVNIGKFAILIESAFQEKLTRQDYNGHVNYSLEGVRSICWMEGVFQQAMRLWARVNPNLSILITMYNISKCK